MPVAQHITRRGGIYRLRCRVPSDLVPVIGRGEIHRSLATACPKEARRRAHRLYGRLLEIFEGLRGMADTKEEWLVQLAAMNASDREAAIGDLFDLAAVGIREMDQERGRREKAEETARALGQQYGELLEHLADTVAPDKLGQLTHWRDGAVALRRQRDDLKQQKDELEGSAIIGQGEAIVAALSRRLGLPLQSANTPTVSGFLADTYTQERRLADDSHRHVVNFITLFARITGDKRLADYGRSDIVGYVRTLEKLSQSTGKSPEDKTASIERLLEKSAGKPTMSATTIGKHSRPAAVHLPFMFGGRGARRRQRMRGKPRISASFRADRTVSRASAQRLRRRGLVMTRVMTKGVRGSALAYGRQTHSVSRRRGCRPFRASCFFCLFPLDPPLFRSMSTAGRLPGEGVMESTANDNEDGGGPFCILRHGRKSHTWGELRAAAAHTSRDPSVSWLGENIDPQRTPRNEVLVGSGDVVQDVRARLAVVGLTPKAKQVVARELLLSASHAHFAGPGQSGRDGDWDPDRLAAWKAAAVEFLQAEFGDNGNLVSVSLHLDEAVPHAHCWVTTAVNVEKKQRGRPRKDGTRPASSMGWTLNHDKVMGSGKDAFANRQDRYAEAMAPLGLQRGQRHSKAHHQPIRQFYAELPKKLAAAEAERQMARELRLQAEQDAIRANIERQGADYATRLARQAQQAAEGSRKAALAAQAEAEATRHRTAVAEQERLALLANVKGERDAVADDKRAMGVFLEGRGLGAEFDQWRADTKAVASLRQNKGPEWIAYEKSLAAYASDLRQHGTWRDVMVRKADRHLRLLFEVGALALGHSSIIRNPARVVTDGVAAWLRISGGNDLVQRHRTVVGWMREFWASVVEAALEEPQRGRGRER